MQRQAGASARIEANSFNEQLHIELCVYCQGVWHSTPDIFERSNIILPRQLVRIVKFLIENCENKGRSIIVYPRCGHKIHTKCLVHRLITTDELEEGKIIRCDFIRVDNTVCGAKLNINCDLNTLRAFSPQHFCSTPCSIFLSADRRVQSVREAEVATNVLSSSPQTASSANQPTDCETERAISLDALTSSTSAGIRGDYVEQQSVQLPTHFIILQEEHDCQQATMESLHSQTVASQLDSELCELAIAATAMVADSDSSTESINGSDALPEDLTKIRLVLPPDDKDDFEIDELFTVKIIGHIDDDDDEAVGFIGSLSCDSPGPEVNLVVPPNSRVESPSCEVTDENLCEFLLSSSLTDDEDIARELEEKLMEIRQARE